MHLRFISSIVAGCFLLAGCGVSITAPLTAAEKPLNVILILADDLGWSDLGCYGADLIETPHLDRLAQQSLRFSQAYAMSVCSPTRAMLMTGKHAARVGITIWSEGSLKGPLQKKLIQGESKHDLPHTERTLASTLRASGYTTGLVGKWHLGNADHSPETHGFDVNVGGTHWGAPHTFWYPYRGIGRFGSEYRYVPHLEYGTQGEYLTDRLTDEALRFIEHAKDRPFFLYLAHHAPHTPIEAKAQDVEYFQTKLKSDDHHQNPVYAAMIRSLDSSVGRLLERLEAMQLDEKTIVIFTSDNGGFIGVDRRSGQNAPVTNNFPLRSGKGSLYEGGIRVPLLIRWPAKTNGGTLCSTPVSLADLHATLLARCATVEEQQAVEISDGLDLTPLLSDPAARLDRDALFFHYPHYYETTTPVSAIRWGDWKLLEYFEDGRRELYHLAADPSESKDLSSQETEKTADLAKRLETWRREVGAKLPTLRPLAAP